METEVALGMILDRFPNLHALESEPERVTNPMLRGFAELRLAW
jgi:cytochrome P450